MKSVNLGGDRLGSGNKQKVYLHGFERSTHDLGNIFRTTMSAGTLVPFMNFIGLPGDTFDIDLNAAVKTLPTVGPLFGSFKLQLDVFLCPIRLYNRKLHNNQLGLGLDIKSVKFPVLKLTGDNINTNSNIPFEFQQINQSSLLAYLGIRGLGLRDTVAANITAKKNALSYLCYFDIFKQYYCNKQEPLAYIVHGQVPVVSLAQYGASTFFPANNVTITAIGTSIRFNGTNISWENLQVQIGGVWEKAYNLAYTSSQYGDENGKMANVIQEGSIYEITMIDPNYLNKVLQSARIDPDKTYTNLKPTLTSFSPSDIDNMKNNLLGASLTVPYEISASSGSPYALPLTLIPSQTAKMYSLCPQEGLLVKTYQSDIFNNWLNTNSITGASGISAITAVSTAGNSFTIDTLNLSKKVYDMLNRIAVSGGSYEDWVSAVYDHNSKWMPESPIYMGGLSKEIVFEEIVSTAAVTKDPLGSLAGRGTLSHKQFLLTSHPCKSEFLQ